MALPNCSAPILIAQKIGDQVPSSVRARSRELSPIWKQDLRSTPLHTRFLRTELSASIRHGKRRGRDIALRRMSGVA